MNQLTTDERALALHRRAIVVDAVCPRMGDPAQIKLMGHSQVLRGHVDSIARAINVANAQPNNQGIATVNPIFTWVRLAQRIPVRIHIDEVPPDIVLSAGMTATVEIEQGAPAK